MLGFLAPYSTNECQAPLPTGILHAKLISQSLSKHACNASLLGLRTLLAFSFSRKMPGLVRGGSGSMDRLIPQMCPVSTC